MNGRAILFFLGFLVAVALIYTLGYLSGKRNRE